MPDSNLPRKLPWFEDVIDAYTKDLMRTVFPAECKNKGFIYPVGAFHLIGAWVLSYGFLLPPSLLWIYLLYAALNVIGYRYFFRNQCFMTLLTNHYGGVQTSPLQIRMRTAMIGLSINVMLAVIGLLFPKWAPYSILRRLFI